MQGTRIFDRGLPEPRVLEFGFGAAGNFSATVTAAEARPGVRLRYAAVDHAPVPEKWLVPASQRAHALATRATQTGEAHDDTVSLQLHRCEFTDVPGDDRFDAIYFDPFGPSQQPDSWSVEVFAAVRPRLEDGGRLATYAAAGWVRRNLAAAGFFVATPPGPAGKRHITVAATTAEALHPLRIRNRP